MNIKVKLFKEVAREYFARSPIDKPRFVWNHKPPLYDKDIFLFMRISDFIRVGEGYSE